jgi:tripartite-type tricarboxylate transporter receptor subunit TctC
MSFVLRPFALAFTFALSALLFSGAAVAQSSTFPNKPVRIVVGFPSGSLLDVIARAIGEELRKGWGQAVLVENKPGADSIIAADMVAKAAPDGYTLFLGTLGALGLNPHLYHTLPYDPARDFAGVTFVADSPFALAVNPELPAKTVQELIALAKASPGKLNYASGASFAQMLGEAFKRRTNTDITLIPYKGVQPAVTDLISGRVQVIFADVPSIIPAYKGGKARIIAVSGSRRSPLVPEAPTIAEAGVTGYDYATWYAFVAPAGTPKDILEKLNAAITGVMASAEMKQRFLGIGLEARASKPEYVNQLIKDEIVRWGPIVKAAGIKQQ